MIHEERFPGMHIPGYILCIAAITMIIGSVVIAVWDMLFLDNYLLTKSNFYQHYYPEIGEYKSLKEFRFNFKEQLLKLLVTFPAISLVIVGLCVLIRNWI